jgi:hypothetical protein
MSMPRITELYAYVVADTGPDDEGVPTLNTLIGPIPMMGADIARAHSLRDEAVLIANHFNKPVKLIRSTGIEVLEIIEPRGKSNEGTAQAD